MTRIDNLRAVAAACHGGADLDRIARRAAWLTEAEQRETLRTLLTSGAIVRDGGKFHPREGTERHCLACGQKVELSRREIFKGALTMCEGCEMRTR